MFGERIASDTIGYVGSNKVLLYFYFTFKRVSMGSQVLIDNHTLLFPFFLTKLYKVMSILKT